MRFSQVLLTDNKPVNEIKLIIKHVKLYGYILTSIGSCLFKKCIQTTHTVEGFLEAFLRGLSQL